MDNFLSKEISSIKERLEKIRVDGSLVFALFSDLHTRHAEFEDTNIISSALHELCQEIRPDAVINLGDNLAMLGREEHITNDRLKVTLTEIFDKMKGAASLPLFLINGNHDAVGTDFFKPSLWNEVVKGKYDDSLASYSDKGSYYYVDYDEANTRLVFISLPSDSDLEGEMPCPDWKLGKEQIDWLDKTALNTGKDILLFTHVPMYYDYLGDRSETLAVWNGEKPAFSYIRSLCGWIEDRDEAALAINRRGNVIACFSGHTHIDALWSPLENRGKHTNPLCCPQVITGRAICEGDNPGIAIDLLVYNPTDKTCNMLRFGYGEDRKIK